MTVIIINKFSLRSLLHLRRVLRWKLDEHSDLAKYGSGHSILLDLLSTGYRKKAYEYWVKTIGTNLTEVLKMEEVDTSKTVSNDIIEVSKVLGIESARNLIIEEVRGTLENVGLIVDLRHIFLIADAMCLDGTVRGIGRYGLSGEADSVLARASFEVPFKHLVEAGLYHESDPFKYVANNIVSNQVIPVGTGEVKLVVKENGKGHSKENAGENKE